MRLLEWSDLVKCIPESQSSFRPGRGTVDNVFTLSSLVQIQLRFWKHPIYTVFIDFKIAFDSIDHNRL